GVTNKNMEAFSQLIYPRAQRTYTFTRCALSRVASDARLRIAVGLHIPKLPEALTVLPEWALLSAKGIGSSRTRCGQDALRSARTRSRGCGIRVAGEVP